MSDLLHYYQIDLRDLFRDEAELSPRYLLSMIIHLPSDGAFYAARVGGSDYRGWDIDRYLKVGILDTLRMANHIQVLVNSDPKRSKPKPPEPFPTPGVEQKDKKEPNLFSSIAASMLDAQRRKMELINGA